MTQIKLTVSWLTNAVLWTTIRWVNKSLWQMKTYAESIAPTDTWKYINSFEIEEATISWNKVIWILRNTDDKASWVESWFRQSPVNRHKWPPRNSSTRIFTWVWAQVQLRTAKYIAPILASNLRW